jgi:hypothetical protein
MYFFIIILLNQSGKDQVKQVWGFPLHSTVQTTVQLTHVQNMSMACVWNVVARFSDYPKFMIPAPWCGKSVWIPRQLCEGNGYVILTPLSYDSFIPEALAYTSYRYEILSMPSTMGCLIYNAFHSIFWKGTLVIKCHYFIQAVTTYGKDLNLIQLKLKGVETPELLCCVYVS